MSFIYSGTTVDKARADDYGQAISLMTKDTRFDLSAMYSAAASLNSIFQPRFN